MRSRNTLHISHIIKVFLKILSILIPVFGLYIVFLPELSYSNFTITNPLLHRFEWRIILVIYFIILSISGVLIFIILSLIFTYTRNRNQKIIPKLTRVFTHYLVDYLYASRYKDENEKKTLCRKIQKFASKKIYIEAFFISITKIQEAVAVNHSNDFKNLLLDTNLQANIESFLFSYNLSDRILALRIISYLRIKNPEFEKQIYIYSDSNNFALRTEAYGALIRLMEGNNQLADFIGSKYNLSMFDINVIVNAVLKNRKMNINYIDFLSSTLNRKIIIGLMLAKHRYRKGSRSLILILNLIGHEDSLINQLAWDSFLNLVPANEGVDIIIEHFHKEPNNIKLMILKNSYNKQSHELYQFLQQVIHRDSLLIKIEAMKILFKEHLNYLTPFIKSDDIEIKRALKEVADININ